MKTYNLFISHSWEHPEDYEKLKGLLEGRPYFNFRNYAVEKDNPKDNWAEVKNNILWSSVVIVIAGMYASYSDPIKEEIMLAKDFKKPTLAIIPRGNERSSDMKNECDEVVGWSTDSIVAAIKKLA